MSGIYNTVMCGDLQSDRIECASQLKICTDDSVPFLITNKNGDVLFSISESGIVFNENEAQSFLELSDTPSVYSDGILKVNNGKIIIEKPVECVKETKLTVEEIITDKLTSDEITTETIKTSVIDCTSGRIKNLKINEGIITSLESEHCKIKSMISKDGQFEAIISKFTESEDIRSSKITTKEVLTDTLNSDTVGAVTIKTDTLETETVKTKILHCDSIVCPLFDKKQVKYGSLLEPLNLAITQQKSIDYSESDDMIIYTKVIKGIDKQYFKILGVPDDKILFTSAVVVGANINFTSTICRVDSEYIVTFYYSARAESDATIVLKIFQ